jgi:hypothetical protein
MAEKKSIVIKLKYPNSHVREKAATTPPKIIKEWNYKRIAFALGGITLLSLLTLYFFFSRPLNPAADIPPTVSSVPETPVQPQQPVATVVITPQPEIANAAADLKKKIVRAQLASKVINSEPVGEISLSVKAGEKNPVPVYYFVELTDMKGQTVYHEWLLDDKLISKKMVNISDQTWRTSSRQMVAYTTNSNWTVRLVDNTGQVLNEQKFTVSLAK